MKLWRVTTPSGFSVTLRAADELDAWTRGAAILGAVSHVEPCDEK